MLEVLADIQRWQQKGEAVALATVISMQGSAPRGVGAKMAISQSGEIAGSISSGCVEPAVINEALEVIESRTPKLLEFGFTPEEVFERIGLSCGGSIRVFIEPLS